MLQGSTVQGDYQGIGEFFYEVRRYTSNTGVEEGTAIEIQTKEFGGVKLGTIDTYVET